LSKLHSSTDIERVLCRRGFTFVRQRGSHQKWRLTGWSGKVVIVPEGRELPRGTFESILKQAGLTHEDFDATL
jgi:predicted RNA binding protein YcfA (HicA-like mRNA interferase family)